MGKGGMGLSRFCLACRRKFGSITARLAISLKMFSRTTLPRVRPPWRWEFTVIRPRVPTPSSRAASSVPPPRAKATASASPLW